MLQLTPEQAERWEALKTGDWRYFQVAYSRTENGTRLEVD